MIYKSEKSKICLTVGEVKEFIKDLPDEMLVNPIFDDEVYNFAVMQGHMTTFQGESKPFGKPVLVISEDYDEEEDLDD